MTLQEIMQQKRFAVVGNTINPEKYAYKIKHELLQNGYKAFGVYKEFSSLNDISDEIDVIDLCINATLGLSILKECRKKFKCVVIQPGAEGDELIQYLKENNIDYLEGCLLVGLKLYSQ